MSALIAMAWYSNGRFTALETSMDWVKNMLVDLKRSIDDANAGQVETKDRVAQAAQATNSLVKRPNWIRAGREFGTPWESQ
ncbi:hypothetical protein [Bradyrhizobium sp. USDA 4486]